MLPGKARIINIRDGVNVCARLAFAKKCFLIQVLITIASLFPNKFEPVYQMMKSNQVDALWAGLGWPWLAFVAHRAAP